MRFTFGHPWFALLLLVLLVSPAAAQPIPAQRTVYLPIVSGPPAPLSPFGFDLRTYAGPEALTFVANAQPKWVRAGDADWSALEPVRGEPYRWETLAELDANVRRIRSINPQIEPAIVVQRSPAWAQLIPGRLCSPPRPEYYDDFARVLKALAEHFSADDLRVNVFEIWNEPDVAPSETPDGTGMGCWMDKTDPRGSGVAYGRALLKAVPAIKEGNPHATVMGGALLYNWPNDALPRDFFNGMLDTGAGALLDAVSFHAYGEWGASDLLVNKTLRLRSILDAYRLPNKPLFATEVATICNGDSRDTCSPNFDQWKLRQANYAARIYPQALALDLKGAFWYTLVSSAPGSFQNSQLIDMDGASLTPRDAYNAFMNSATLLQGARYVGQPLLSPPSSANSVRELIFRKPRSVWAPGQPSTLHVLWQQQFDATPQSYPISVPPGATAVCYTRLDLKDWVRFDCSDKNADGLIWFGVIDFPQYVEVLDR